MSIIRVAIIITLGAFAVFMANVLGGAFMNTRFLSDVGEMLMLVLSCLFFVVLILALERRGRNGAGK